MLELEVSEEEELLVQELIAHTPKTMSRFVRPAAIMPNYGSTERDFLPVNDAELRRHKPRFHYDPQNAYFRRVYFDD